MGTIRLLLALAVVFGHASAFGIIPPYTPQFGYFPIDATLAVHLFFVVSGFYMGLVLDEKYRNLDGWVWRFYLNRYFRLMPTYLVVVAVITFTVNEALHYPPPGLRDRRTRSAFGLGLWVSNDRGRDLRIAACKHSGHHFPERQR